MRFKEKKMMKPKLLIFDLDDTLYQRFGVVGDDYSGLENIRMYLGAYDFLRKGDFKKVLVSMGESAIQIKKLELLGIKNLFDLVLICSTSEEKKNCFERVQKRFPDYDLWVVGDRVDSEIRYGKALEMKTVLLRRGKYKNLKARDNLEIPDYEILDFLELESLLKCKQ